MAAVIQVDRHELRYTDGPHTLVLSVEWSGVSKTADHPTDFEISTDDMKTWTEPAGEPIDADQRERVLDEIAEYYSKAPAADIIGSDGSLLRGVSTFRFALQIYPEPSRYWEVGRFLAIPMAPPKKGSKVWEERYVLDFTGVTMWTRPRVPIEPQHLSVIAERIVREQKIGVTGLAGYRR